VDPFEPSSALRGANLAAYHCKPRTAAAASQRHSGGGDEGSGGAFRPFQTLLLLRDEADVVAALTPDASHQVEAL
jgi:hypothetical protein